MLANSKGKKLWIADENGGLVAVKTPADISKRPRGQGLPDWWVLARSEDWLPPDAMATAPRNGSLLSLGLVAGAGAGGGAGTKIGAGGKPQGYDSHGRYTGPRGGAASMRDGGISTFGQDGRMYADAGKRAGADSEAGKQEPKSLLSATAEQLDKIASGTGQAVTQGAAGAGQALSRTWEELSTNEELHKGVEFGVKAAGEVSKDVGMQVGKHAAAVYGGHKLSGTPGEPRWTNGLGPVPGLVWTGVNSYKSFPQKGQDIGNRIRTLHDRIYGKEKE